MRSQCYPDTYWFAKYQLDEALKLIAKCEKDPVAGERGLAALADVKKGVEAMLEERKKSYEDEWKAKGRDPPDEDEWYEIVEGKAGDGDGEGIELIGEAFKGGDSPFLGRDGKFFLSIWLQVSWYQLTNFGESRSVCVGR